MKVLFALFAILSVAQVQALCPGAKPCSGHGTCGGDDKCSCYRDFTGIDCNSRRCPFTKSWADTAAHSYAECGGRGTCDTKTGKCACFDGFSGRGCARLNCPANCNNRGTCELFGDVNSLYTGWDANKIQVCVCDAGFSGPSCANRICPKGNDPITAYDSSGVAEVDDIVQLALTGSGDASTGFFALTYTDHEGNVWKTRAINIATTSEITIQEALMSIPNAAVPDVTCTTISGTIGASNAIWRCTFSHSLMGGDHTTKLAVDKTACAAHGCQPVISPALDDTITITNHQAGTTEHIECSGRGTCDAEVGTCTCVKGYTGEACEIQTIIT